MTSPRRFRLFACGVLAINVAVICWGAYVRASGSGAGCGNHWPMCKDAAGAGEDRIVELLHRLTTGAAGLLVAALIVLAFRSFPRRSPVRKAAGATAAFYVLEALIGGAIVKLGLVAYDPSLAHALAMAIHLVNTLFLLGSLALIAWFADAPPLGKLRDRGPLGWLLAATLGATLLLAMTGAVAALADLIYPAASFRAGLAHDLSADASTLVHLRTIHPVLAVLTAVLILATCRATAEGPGTPHTPVLARILTVLVFVQMAIGLLNLGFAAPTLLQMLHLIVADAVWVCLVLLTASVLGLEQPAGGPELPAPRSPSVVTRNQ